MKWRGLDLFNSQLADKNAEQQVPISRSYIVPIKKAESSVQPSTPEPILTRTIHFERFAQKQHALFKPVSENLISQTRRRPRIHFKRRALKASATLLIVGLLISVLPLKQLVTPTQAKITADATRGWQEIDAANASLSNQKYDEAIAHFTRARENFTASLKVLQETGQTSLVLAQLSRSNTYKVAQALLIAAQDMSEAGQNGAVLMQSVSQTVSTSQHASSSDPFDGISQIITGLLQSNQANIQLAQKIMQSINHANTILQADAGVSVSDKRLESIRQTAITRIPQLLESGNAAIALLQNLPEVVGTNRNRRYLVLFENNRELRPGGGFLGSFATTILSNGKVSAFSVETNIYKRDGAFSKIAHRDPPYPLSHIVQENWFLRDANMAPDYPSSSRQIAQFFKEEGGTDVDGVISIDLSSILSLLKVTGPIYIKEKNMTLDANNFADQVQFEVEERYKTDAVIAAANEPKKVIADIFPTFLSRVFAVAQDRPSDIIKALHAAIAEKHIRANFFFKQGEALVASGNLNNALPQSGDFLMVNNDNLGGQKSSQNIDQNVDVQLEPTNHDTILHTVTVTRTHTGSLVWPDGDNRNYISLVVPYDAAYIDATSNGPEINIPDPSPRVDHYNLDPSVSGTKSSTRYQTIGLWQTTHVGQTTRSVIHYQTPIESSMISHSYVFQYVKQQGWKGDNLNLQFTNKHGWQFTVPQTTYTGFVATNETWRVGLSKPGLLGHLPF